jgi:hypothetical protein
LIKKGLPANAHLNRKSVPQRASEASASQWPVVKDQIPAIIPAVFPVIQENIRDSNTQQYDFINMFQFDHFRKQERSGGDKRSER